jgi:hypothetical protein
MAAATAAAPGGSDEAAWVEMMLASEGPLTMEQARTAHARTHARTHAHVCDLRRAHG